MMFYFSRVTGSPFVMPYQLNRLTYATAPIFFFSRPRTEPHYNHVVMRDFYQNWEQALYNKTLIPKGVLIRTLGKFVTLWMFYFGPVLTLPLLMLHRAVRDRRLRWLWPAALIGSIGFIAPAWFNAHYAAPMIGFFYIVMMQGLRHLRWCRWRGRPTGLFLARAVPLICLLMVPARLLAGPLHIDLGTNWRLTWSHASPGMTERARIEQQLTALPGQHLVIVRYRPDHDYHTEWVYNAADIDGAKVVWAREMDTGHNQKLIEYFNKRMVWLLEADEKPARLVTYDRWSDGK
jgi:hypothetical protein